MTNNPFKLRHKARYVALQALYGWSITNNNLHGIETYFLQDRSSAKIDAEYFRDLLYNIPTNLQQLDELITPYLKRPLAEVNAIELTILRMATYEFQYKLAVPYRVIINEYLLLTKKFGATDSHKFVNGILDKLAKMLRSTEFNE